MDDPELLEDDVVDVTYVDTAFEELEAMLEDWLEAKLGERVVDVEVMLNDDDVEDRDEDELDELLAVEELATLQPATQMAAMEPALYVKTPIELFI